MRVQLLTGETVNADYIRHLRTLTGNASLGNGNVDVDAVRLADGRVIAASWDGNARHSHDECDKPPQAYGYAE